MVSKKKNKKIKTKDSSSTWEEQEEWEEFLRRMSTPQIAETEVCCSTDTLNRDSVKRTKNESKKLKRKEKGRHVSWNAETLLCNDFETSVKRKKEKRLKKHKDKHQKQNKNKDESELQDSCLHPLPVKRRKDKKSKRLGGSDQKTTFLFDQCAETLASQEIRFTESGRDVHGSFRSHHPVSEGSHHLKQEPAKAQSHSHPKSKNGAPDRKRVVLDSLPCSFECVSSQVRKLKEETEHMEASEPSSPGTFGKDMLLKSILVSRKAYVTFEDEDKALDPLRENDSKESQLTAENISQELFITQKTFLPAQSSSEESTGAFASYLEPRDGQYSGACPQLSQELFVCRSTSEKATQTDGFFSSPALSTSLGFRKLRQKRECTEQALDLSVPRRPNGESAGHADPQVKQEHGTDRDPLCPKLTGAASDEQDRALAPSKAGGAQLKAVQTRLNESFFFKMKGGGESPVTQSPLLDCGPAKSKTPQMKTTVKARRPSDQNS